MGDIVVVSTLSTFLHSPYPKTVTLDVDLNQTILILDNLYIYTLVYDHIKCTNKQTSIDYFGDFRLSDGEL